MMGLSISIEKVAGKRPLAEIRQALLRHGQRGARRGLEFVCR